MKKIAFLGALLVLTGWGCAPTPKQADTSALPTNNAQTPTIQYEIRDENGMVVEPKSAVSGETEDGIPIIDVPLEKSAP